MAQAKGAMRWGGIFMGVSAALHAVGLIISGFSTLVGPLLVFGVVLAGLAFAVLQGRRWAAYLAFIVALMGLSFAAGNIWSLGAVPAWVFQGILATNVLAVLALFGALWRTIEQPA